MLLHLLTIYLLVCKKRCILSNVSAQLVHLQQSSGYTSLQLGDTRHVLDPHLEVLAPAQYELTPQSNLLASRLFDRLQSAQQLACGVVISGAHTNRQPHRQATSRCVREVRRKIPEKGEVEVLPGHADQRLASKVASQAIRSKRGHSSCDRLPGVFAFTYGNEMKAWVPEALLHCLSSCLSEAIRVNAKSIAAAHACDLQDARCRVKRSQRLLM